MKPRPKPYVPWAKLPIDVRRRSLDDRRIAYWHDGVWRAANLESDYEWLWVVDDLRPHGGWVPART